MANVKITELTELAAVDVADNDVVPIVDVGGDTTKKVTAASLRTYASEANDFITYTVLNANIDVVSSNADAYNVQLNANIDVVQDNVTSQNSYITSTYATLLLLDSVQDNVGSAESNVASLRVEYLANVASTEANVNAVESRRADNTFFTYNTDSNVIITDANVEPSSNNIYSLGAPDLVWKDVYVGPGTLHLGPLRLHSNDDGTGLLIRDANDAQVTIDTGVANVTANLNLLQDNVAAAESNVVALDTRVNANVDVVQDNVATLTTTVDNFGSYANTTFDTKANVSATYIQLNANVDVVQDNLTVYTGSSNAGIRVAVEQFGNLALQSNTVDFALLDSFSPTHAEGRVHYDTERNSLRVAGPSITSNVHVGQDEMIYVKNTSGDTIDRVKPVYLVSEDGGIPTIALANAATETTAYVAGLTADSIADGEFGFVQRAGIVFGDTTGLTAGNRIHLGPTAGLLQETAPTYPYFTVDVGIVLSQMLLTVVSTLI
jgi:hypothetical protein